MGKRIATCCCQALDDEELLEFLLSRAEPKCDVKETARALIKHFGGLAAVLEAKFESLSCAHDLGLNAATLLKVIPEIARRMSLEEIRDRPILSTQKQVLAYCRITLGWKNVEHFVLLFLDNKNKLIAAEQQQRGTINQVQVYPREIVKRALELYAFAIIMVHNHPSGDPTPSSADIEITRQVQAAASTVGVTLHDHIVIGRAGHNSFKSLGLL